MDLVQIVGKLCDLANALEQAGVSAEQVARIDRITEALVALIMPLLRGQALGECCPTCGTQLFVVEAPQEHH